MPLARLTHRQTATLRKRRATRARPNKSAMPHDPRKHGPPAVETRRHTNRELWQAIVNRKTPQREAFTFVAGAEREASAIQDCTASAVPIRYFQASAARWLRCKRQSAAAAPAKRVMWNQTGIDAPDFGSYSVPFASRNDRNRRRIHGGRKGRSTQGSGKTRVRLRRHADHRRNERFFRHCLTAVACQKDRDRSPTAR